MIDVSNTITVYEVNNEEVNPGERVDISIRSHWNRKEWIVLIIDGKRLTLNAGDVRAAIENATNTAKY